MFYVIIFVLGMTLGAAGMFANQINSSVGMQIANRKVHSYFTMLGALSNQVIPIIAVICTVIAQGFVPGVAAALLLLAGGFCFGLIRPSYLLKLLVTLFGTPTLIMIFFISLMLYP